MYGVPVGSDAYCRNQLMEVAKGIVSDGQKTAELLSGERQDAALSDVPVGRLDPPGGARQDGEGPQGARRISIQEEGNFVPRLHELKIISSSKTR